MSTYMLDKGAHKTAEDGKCAMEWVSFLAGEPHSDEPVCVSPMLQEFCISLNDALPDVQRQRLRPYLARTIGTAGDGLDGSRRWLCADWLIREYAPTWLELVPGLVADAERLRSLPPVLAVENVQRAMVDLDGARQRAAAARDAAGAAWDAARDAARDAWDAAWAAARAAWDAAGVARDAARDAAGAAWNVAGAAARAAARDAAWDALQPSALKLQNSVLSPGGLLDRMLPLEPLVLPVVSEWREVCGVVDR